MRDYMNAQGLFDPGHRLVTSYLFSSKALSAIRLLFALYTTFTFVFVWVWDAERLSGPTNRPRAHLSYFTHLSWLGLASYFWASGLHTFAFSRHRSRLSYPLQHWPQALQYLHVLLRSTIVTFPILVTIVYWALIADSATFASPFSTWTNISQHVLNSAFCLFETIFTNALPPPWMHLPISLLILGGYLCIAYVTHAAQGFYPYAFLDPSHSPRKLAIYIVGIMLLHCVVFALVYCMTALRERLAPKLEKSGTGKVLQDDDGVQYYPLQHSNKSVAEVC